MAYIIKNSTSIQNKLELLFAKRFNLNLKKLLEEQGPEVLSEDLLGEKFLMEARDLLCLFFSVEEEFGITIPEEEIINGNFRTVRNIVGIIENSFKQKEVIFNG